MSNFPNGFLNGVTIRGVPITQLHPGKVFWVNNSTTAGHLPEKGIAGADAAGGKGTYLQPFKTIDYAIGRCSGGRGDIIVVMPNHSETVTTDGGIACDVAGVAIVGLGTGTSRPQIVLDSAAAAAVTVSAANVSMYNLHFVASFADVTNAIDVTAANLTVLNCEFSEEGADLNFVDIISATGADNTADGLHVEGCVSTGIDAAIDSFILAANTIDRLVVKDNVVNHMNASALALVEGATGAAFTDCLITGNHFATLATTFVGVVTDTTTSTNGFMTNNHFMHRDTAGELVCTAGTNICFSQNYASGVAAASGYLLPAADS